MEDAVSRRRVNGAGGAEAAPRGIGFVRVKLERSPGYMARRLHQTFVAIFHQELEPFGLTPIQYTILTIVRLNPGIDQVSVAAEAVLDPSTVADVLKRLGARGLIRRESGPTDRRTRIVFLTPEGERLMEQARAYVMKARKRLMAPLSKSEQAEFLEMMDRLLKVHEAGSSPWSRTALSRSGN